MSQDSPAPPTARPPALAITETEAEDLVHGICFKTGPPRFLGAELEWLVLDAERPGQPLSPERLRAAHAAARALPLHSRVTVEPGGQLELSSAPATSLSGCVDSLQDDLTAVRAALLTQGWSCTATAATPAARTMRLLASPATTRWRPTSTAPARPGAP